MATKRKVVKASDIKTKKQYDEAIRKGWEIQYTEGNPAPRKKSTRRK